MPIIGVFFDRMEAERDVRPGEKIPPLKSVQHNNRIRTVNKITLKQMNQEVDVIEIKFEFKTYYNPSIATFSLEGFVMFLPLEVSANEILGAWSKKRQLHEKISPMVLNAIMSRCIQKAFVLSDHIGVPPPLPPPPIKPTQKKKESDTTGMFV